MDPVSVLGLVASLVQLVDATSKVIGYLNDLKDAPKERARLAREATSLLTLLTDLRFRIEEAGPTDPWCASLRSLGVDQGPLDQLRRAMEELASKLVPTKQLRRVLWTLDKKTVENLLSQIERIKSLISLALQKDHL